MNQPSRVVGEPFDEENLRPSGLMSQRNDRLVFGVGVPGAGVFEGRKLEDHDALCRPSSLDHLTGSTDDDRSSAMPLFDGRRLFGVLDIEVGIAHIEQNHCVSPRHSTTVAPSLSSRVLG